ncbi:hypothetical protein [Jannaschia sp. CCS1]|uniref:hypothetical protein n=1 Tax=Jannaschia sp. (strain CCS1) TaxID=290400 RepID=UPI000053B414|nr:hypothetical protein [Jannaschia sp. CCS1]ABD53465.1 hypothetical protein Jann_0548 [Jannaschia sp. CCS1]
MAVRTGYKTAELAAQAERIKLQAAALVADLPRQPLQVLELVCACDRCIDPPAYDQLIRTPPPQLTTYMVGQYFGGAGAVKVETGMAEQREARIILTHVLAHLGEAVCRSREEERKYYRQAYFIEPAYWIEGLFRTGVIDTLSHEVATQIRVYLMEVVTHASAKGSARLNDALTYLALATTALPDVLERYRTGPSRRHLRFWTSVAGGLVQRGPDGQNPRGVDLYKWFDAMPEPAVETLVLALDHPDTERMMERYALAAQDRDWLTYLSRLMQWREATLAQSFFSDRVGR